jgi:hypothetical protein
MEIYWSHKRRPSEIIEAQRCAEAEKLEEFSSKDMSVKTGKGVVFFQELEYGIAGFSLTSKELRTLAEEADRRQKC